MSDYGEADEVLHRPTNRPLNDRDTGDRVPPPEWFLADLLDRAAALFAEADLSADWGDRVTRWLDVWRTAKANRE